ncbi:MAG: hypothetical protein FJX76_28020, partial [Armatimonadetes bacterium]|nr:hypothetical protein [Armatimonadota bacterium]
MRPLRGRDTPPKREVHRQSYPAIAADGSTVATHVRIDCEDGGKEFWWERDGRKDLGGLRVVDLPLYNLPALRKADAQARVVV